MQLRFRLLAGYRGRWTGGSLSVVRGILGRAHRRRQGVPGAGEIRDVQTGSSGVLRCRDGPTPPGSIGASGARRSHMVRAARRGGEARCERADATGTRTASDTSRMTAGTLRAAAPATASATAGVSTLILLTLFFG